MASSKRSKAGSILLSSDIIMWEILVRLPVKTIYKFRCVSKSWYDLLFDPNFLRLHWRKSKQNPALLVITPDYEANRIPFFTMKMNNEHDGKRRVAGSAVDLGFDMRHSHKKMSACHGLVLVYNRYTIRIWNPATGERIDIDVPVPNPTGRKDIVQATIGYVKSTGEYKVLIFETRKMRDPDRYTTCFKVLTIGSGGWRATKNPPFNLILFNYGTCNIAVVNRFIHVLPASSSDGIARFDLEEEDWSVIPSIDWCHLSPYDYYDLLLKEVNGFLCLVQFRKCRCCADLWFLEDSDQIKCCADIWFLKDYNKGIWVKEYTIDISYHLEGYIFEQPLLRRIHNRHLLPPGGLYI